ncbi:MAG: B12-binding domain-containing radical SAM protein [Deltaproteobacteria bacterium]|nr:B12-binding domain-containing radical SAM protein [Deltaproteobacteria bacterium]
MKVLLLQPPVEDFYHTGVRLQPLGLASLKAALGRWLPDVRVTVRDYHHGWGRRTVPLPPELAHLRAFYPVPDRSPFSTFHGYFHFGASYGDLAEDVAKAQPDLVGISCLFSPYYREALRAAEAVKALRPVPVVVGGAHASAAPLSVLESPAVDFVVRGEGERPLVELVRAVREGRPLEAVPNLCFKRGGELVTNRLEPNFALDELPPPDFSDLGADRYFLDGEPLCTLLASRGCPHRCSFCSVHATSAGFRRRPAKDVVAEVRARRAEGYRVFDFEDDNFLCPVEEGKELLRALAEAFPNGRIRFTAMNGLPYWDLDGELLALLRRAGFRDLNLALVTADRSAGLAAGRPKPPERFAEVVRAAFALGFRIVSYQILGLPGETLDSTVETLGFAARLPVLLGASPFYLVPGSRLGERFGPLGGADFVRARLTGLGFEGAGVERENVYTLFVTTRILNFLKGLSFPGDRVPLATLLRAAAEGGGRAGLGADGLERLLSERRLYAFPRRGPPVPLPAFRPELFLRVWSTLGWVETQDGKRIEV